MRSWILALWLGVSGSAMADRMPLPSDTPASFSAECGSCHLAFPPQLLSATDWRTTMRQLSTHFGTDAAVDPKTQREIAAFLERNAGNASRLAGAGDPPRISRTARFERKHREIPRRFWRDPRIKSAANCEGCHRGAAQGKFSEHDLLIPELER